ncbi:uncharacterized protein LOC131308493 [Rhododendron vialii]|uniref:uncharacterized protein LOC131308493 n=1 Tax=Rhododendron vialii TaxID=182163 RepID=UPI00265E5D96|nr:uncharacterized protein LOC131308493 [Rhododendron vialii]
MDALEQWLRVLNDNESEVVNIMILARTKLANVFEHYRIQVGVVDRTPTMQTTSLGILAIGGGAMSLLKIRRLSHTSTVSGVESELTCYLNQPSIETDDDEPFDILSWRRSQESRCSSNF